jgi:hypothetical protein
MCSMWVPTVVWLMTGSSAMSTCRLAFGEEAEHLELSLRQAREIARLGGSAAEIP